MPDEYSEYAVGHVAGGPPTTGDHGQLGALAFRDTSDGLSMKPGSPSTAPTAGLWVEVADRVYMRRFADFNVNVGLVVGA